MRQCRNALAPRHFLCAANTASRRTPPYPYRCHHHSAARRHTRAAAIPVPLPSSLRRTPPYPCRRHHHPAHAAHSTALVASIASAAAIITPPHAAIPIPPPIALPSLPLLPVARPLPVPQPLPVPLAPLTTSPLQKRQKGQKKLAFSKTLRYTFSIKKTIMSNN